MANTAELIHTRPIVISGPSGVGKGTLISQLRGKYPNLLATTVSHTTRQPRAGEVDRHDYFFVSEAGFQQLLSEDSFIEWARFSGDHYGTGRQTIYEQTSEDRTVILDIDVQGAKAIKADATMQARYVFIKPPTFEALEQRLRGLQTESETDVQKRLAQARIELEEVAPGDIYDLILVNEDLETSLRELERFVFEKGIAEVLESKE